MAEDARLYSYSRLRKFSENILLLQRLKIHGEVQYSYAAVIKEAKEFQRLLSSNIAGISLGIALNFEDHTPALCVALLSILNGDYFFCPLSFDGNISGNSLAKRCINFDIHYLLSDIIISDQNSFSKVFQTTVFCQNLYFYKIYTSEMKSLQPFQNICYCICTSGSTGQPKLTYVPYSCIAPNIYSLSNRLSVTYKDVLLLYAPITFDLFIFELFLALYTGASILITSRAIRLTSNKLTEVLFPRNATLRGVTFIQMTTSLFRLSVASSINELGRFFNKGSSLRILLLGGEDFPSVEEWRAWLPEELYPWHCGKKIYNIYGITEISCWSTIYEWTADDKCIPIGDPIDNHTMLRIIDDKGMEIYGDGTGVLQIGSKTRICYSSREEAAFRSDEFVKYCDTGDLVERNKNSVFYKGRINNTVKRFGNRICLDQITSSIEKLLCGLQSSVASAYDKNNNQLIVFICLIEKHVSKEQKCRLLIKENLGNHEKPDKIIFINRMPLTYNGKKCTQQLLQQSISSQTPKEKFNRFLKDTLGIEVDLDNATHPLTLSKICFKSYSNISFAAAGGTSFNALSLANEIRADLNTADRKQFLELLLNEQVPLINIIKYLESATLRQATPEVALLPLVSTTELTLLWRINLHKCVDATPTEIICEGHNYVCAGSHARIVVTVDGLSGNKVAEINLPDRIESQVTFSTEHLALVCCYDGHLYEYDFLKGMVLWNYNCGGMIKSRPIKFEDCIIVASYAVDCNLICVCKKTRTAKWRKKIGTKGILATPLLLKSKTLIVCTLDGSYVCVVVMTGAVIWKQNLSSPIFSNPATAFEETLIFIAEVGGVINACSITNGEKVSRFVCDGNIFSGIGTHRINDHNCFVMFGCHDNNLYCLKYNSRNNLLVKHWKYNMMSPIYATPSQFSDGLICTCNTKGTLVVLSLCSGRIIAEYSLQGENFSSPCISDDESRLYIGCRDNFLYCLGLPERSDS